MKPIVAFQEYEMDIKCWHKVYDLSFDGLYYRVDPEGPRDRVIPERITEQI